MSKNVRLIDIARRIGRDRSAIVLWEELGLIPKALRDSLGRRYYTSTLAEEIIERAKKTNYFKNSSPTKTMSKHSPRLMYLSIMLAVAFILSQLYLFG